MNKGYLHVYTGNGKGKTTAAIGLAIRAAGAGKRVFFGQFVKGDGVQRDQSAAQVRGSHRRAPIRARLLPAQGAPCQ